MGFFIELIGKEGVIFTIFSMVFFIIYKYSIPLFSWIEDHTYGTKDYIQKQFELLHYQVKEEHIFYGLLTMSFGMAVLVMAVFFIFGQFLLGFFFGLIAFFIGWKAPRPIVDYLVQRRIQVYQGQMTDALGLLANGLRAGLSIPQSLGMVVEELKPPITEEFAQILQENRIGQPLEDCFENLVKRVPTEDNQMFVTGVNILRETGGNLAETFDTICDVIRERVRLQQKIDTYIAQGMIQGMTIFSMPFVMGFIYYLSDPDTMSKLFTTPIGIVAVVAAIILDLIGGYFILKIVSIKV